MSKTSKIRKKSEVLYHISLDNVARVCRATKVPCKLQHFKSLEEAQKVADSQKREQIKKEKEIREKLLGRFKKKEFVKLCEKQDINNLKNKLLRYKKEYSIQTDSKGNIININTEFSKDTIKQEFEDTKRTYEMMKRAYKENCIDEDDVNFGIKKEIKKPDDLAREVLEKGGFSYNPHNKTTPTAGFMCSFAPEVYTEIDITDEVGQTRIAKEIKVFIERNSYLCASCPNNNIGGWVSENHKGRKILYLDVSTQTFDAEQTRKMGNEYDQIAFLELGTFEEIEIDRNNTSGQQERIENE